MERNYKNKDSNSKKNRSKEFSDYLKNKMHNKKKDSQNNPSSKNKIKKNNQFSRKNETDIFANKQSKFDNKKSSEISHKDRKYSENKSNNNVKNKFNSEKENKFQKNFEKPKYQRDKESDFEGIAKKEMSIYGVLKKDNRFYTKNLVQKHKTYDEKLVYFDDIEYREWNPNKSKIGSAIKKNIKIEFNKKMNVLYLGASTGTTVSHLSDIITDGKIFAVEFAARVFRELIFEAQLRNNIYPILANASKLDEYIQIVPQVDMVFQDIAQKNQAQIFVKNMNLFLKKKGIGMIAVKARSIDVTKKPRQVYREVEEYIRKNNFEILEVVPLNPYEKDHAIIICRNP